MISYAQWGNQLYTGKRSYGIVKNRKYFLGIGLALIVTSMLALAIFGLNPGIDFKGGAQFTVTNAGINPSQSKAYDVLEKEGLKQGSRVYQMGTTGLQIQTTEVDIAKGNAVSQALQQAFDQQDSANPTEVAQDTVGPSWGKDVSRQAVKGLVIFLILVSLLMILYFRTWTMAAAALGALAHDFFITIGIYALAQFEVTPATIIGFLTILGYSLYDTVVVFDKIRENSDGIFEQSRYKYSEIVNLSINQTMVRSINTSIVAILPVSSILFIGSFWLGGGPLRDISLPLFIGIIAGTFSSIFIAAPLLTWLRGMSKVVAGHDEKVDKARSAGLQEGTDAQDALVSTAARVAPLAPGSHLGQGAQPKRKGRGKK